MGSHGGQQNLPFGYDVDNLHGIGLPNFLSPGPPPGQPLLNEHDSQTLNSFFNGFEAGDGTNKQGLTHPFAPDIGPEQDWLMPPTFVGSETSFRGRAGIDWQSGNPHDFQLENDLSLSQLPQPGGYDNTQLNNYSQMQFDSSLLHHIHSVAHGDLAEPNFGPIEWQQSFQNPAGASIPPKPMMRFGSDQHFQPGGYAAPEGQFVPTALSLDWLEPHSSANNTQPNTRPNTQPSSPIWTKKRKLEDYQDHVSLQNNNLMNINTQSTAPVQRPRSSKRKDQTPVTPASGHPSHQKLEEESSDAQYEDDDDDQITPSTESWPAHKSRPSNSKSSPTKNSRSRRKSPVSNTPLKLKSKSSRPGVTAPSNAARVPLTADQKKANHTNSEQRRRDATAKAYAELYDLIPELNEVGKQSTMKKLEIVVAKVVQVKETVAQLRLALGMDIETGVPQTESSGYSAHGSSGMANMFDTGASWQQDR